MNKTNFIKICFWLFLALVSCLLLAIGVAFAKVGMNLAFEALNRATVASIVGGLIFAVGLALFTAVILKIINIFKITKKQPIC